MTDVEKSEISFVVCTIYGILLHFTLFCCQICFFLAIYAVLSHYRFFRFTHYYVEKNLAKNSARGEEITNMRYVLKYQGTVKCVRGQLQLNQGLADGGLAQPAPHPTSHRGGG